MVPPILYDVNIELVLFEIEFPYVFCPPPFPGKKLMIHPTLSSINL